MGEGNIMHGKTTNNKRGVIFSIDALLAVVVLALATGSIYFFMAQSQVDVSLALLQKKQADDLLSMLDWGGAIWHNEPKRA